MTVRINGREQQNRKSLLLRMAEWIFRCFAPSYRESIFEKAISLERMYSESVIDKVIVSFLN
jgi:hypothetical protein